MWTSFLFHIHVTLNSVIMAGHFSYDKEMASYINNVNKINTFTKTISTTKQKT